MPTGIPSTRTLSGKTPAGSLGLFRGGGRGLRGERGSASLELVGAVPLVLLTILIAAQIGVAGHALWSAGTAARAGARAVLTGKPPRPAAERALPGPLRADLRVSNGEAVRVGVRVPRLIPGFPATHVYGSSSMGEG